MGILDWIIDSHYKDEKVYCSDCSHSSKYGSSAYEMFYSSKEASALAELKSKHKGKIACYHPDNFKKIKSYDTIKFKRISTCAVRNKNNNCDDFEKPIVGWE